MAQVRKYQEGGSTHKKYGTFTIDDNKYEVDDDFLNQLTNYGKSLNEDVAYQFSNIIDALRSGEDISYNSNKDSIEGNVQFDLNKRQTRRMDHRRSGFGRFLGRAFKGKEEDARNAIHALKDFTYIKPTPTRTNYDWSKELKIEYEKDENGKYKLVDGKRVFINGANNIQILNRLAHLHDILNYDNNDTFNGFGNLKKEDYINLYNNWGAAEIERLQKAIRDGSITEKDLEAINDIGIKLDPGKTDEEIEQERLAAEDPEVKAEREAKARYQKAGINYDWRNIFGVDDNGRVTIIDPTLQSYIGTGDAWLNDLFRNKYSAYADYIPEGTGLFVINGQIYKGSDQASLSKIQKYLDFVAENRRTAGNASGIKQYWEDNQYSGWSDLGQDNNGNPVWSPVFKPGQFGRDMSGHYIRQTGDPYIFDYYPNYDAENNELFDQFGHPLRDKATRIYIDPRTKEAADVSNTFIDNLREQTNNQAIQNYYANEAGSAFKPYYTLNGVGNIVEMLRNADGNNPNTGYSLFQKPGTDLYYWYDENPGGDNYILNSVLPSGEDKMRDYIWNIDPRLGQYLMQNPEVLRDVRVKNAISGFIRNPYLATMSSRTTKTTDYLDLQKKYPALMQILSEFYNNGITLGYGNNRKTYSGNGGNQELRDINSSSGLESRGLAYRYNQLKQIPYQKQGGVLKFQIGGVNTSESRTIRTSKDPIQHTDSKLRKAGEDKVIGDGTDLTASDKAELAALIGDAASLGATFVPVYGNAFGAGVGAASSLAGFYADAVRDGLDWGDAGSLLVNLGLDAATLLPGIGTGAKAAKVAKALGKSKAVAKAIKYAANTFSIGNAGAGLITAWNNVQDGKWTIKDLRTVLNGIRGVANLKRTTGSAKTKDKVSDTVTLKSKSQDLPEVKLSRSEIESVQKAPKNERSDKLTQLISSKLPEGTNVDQVQDILSNYGINRSNTSNWSWNHPFTFSKSSTVNTDQFDYDVIPGTYRDSSKMYWWNWNRRAAIRDAKINKENPYFRPLHWETGKVSDLNSIQPITMPIYSNFAPDLGIFSNTPEERYYYNPNDRPIFYKEGGKILKAKEGSQFGHIESDKEFFINPDMILGIGDFITSVRGINRSNQKMKDAIYKGMIGSQQQMPTEFYSRFSDNGLHRMYADRINNMRQYKTVTSDPNQVMTEGLMRDMNVDQMENERDTKFSQIIDQYNDKLLAQKQQYSNMRTQIVNDNKNRWYQGLAQLDMADANKISQQTQNVKNLIYQLRGNYAKDLERRNQIEEKLNQINANIDAQNELKKLFNEIGGFDGMTPEEKTRWGNDWQGYTAYKVPDRVAKIQNQGLFDFYKNRANNRRNQESWVPWLSNLNISMSEIDSIPSEPVTKNVFMKKGGTIQRFRNVGEQAYLDQQKAINKAVNDLNNNIIKLFIKMMS